MTDCSLNITVSTASILSISFTGNMFLTAPGGGIVGYAAARETVAVDGVDRTDLVDFEYTAYAGPVQNPVETPAGFTVRLPVSAGTHAVTLRMRMANVWGPYVMGTGIGYNGKSSQLSVLAFSSPPAPSGNLTWSTKAPMPTARLAFGAVAAIDGKLYAIGGEGPGLVHYATVEAYDPIVNTWTTRQPMPTARYDVGVTQAPNGLIYAIGGVISLWTNVVEAYNPSTDSWTGKSPMPTARHSFGVATATNGKIYAVGGFNGTDLSTVEEYSPSSDSWAVRQSMGTPRTHLAVAAAPNGKIYAIGGANSAGALAIVEEYDPATNVWTTKAPLPSPRMDLAVAVGANGRLYAIGGDPIGNVMEYDLITDTWANRGPMLTNRVRLAAVGTSGGALYAIGGRDCCNYLATNEASSIVP